MEHIVDSKDTSGIANSYGKDVFNAIESLSEGQVSDVITGDNGYYFVKVTSTDKKTLKKELKKTDIDSPLLAYDDYLQYVVYNSYKINYKDKDIKKMNEELITEGENLIQDIDNKMAKLDKITDADYDKSEKDFIKLVEDTVSSDDSSSRKFNDVLKKMDKKLGIDRETIQENNTHKTTK